MENNFIPRNNITTPAFLVFQDPLVKNCDHMLERCKAWNVSLRPHIKTHKTIEGALYQLFGSNYKSRNQIKEVKRKIVVATMGEAEVFKCVIYFLQFSFLLLLESLKTSSMQFQSPQTNYREHKNC